MQTDLRPRTAGQTTVPALMSALVTALLLLAPTAALAQSPYDSGSTGADGALVFSPVPESRVGHSMAYDAARQRVVLFGGHGASNTWLWDGTRWEQVVTKDAPSPRRNAAMAYDSARQRVVLFGGEELVNGTTTAGVLDDTWEWDGVTWTKLSPATSPPARRDSAMVYVTARSRMLLHGGNASATNTQDVLDDTWTFDGTTWTQLAPTTAPKVYLHAMAYDSVRDRVVLAGPYGENTSRSSFVDASFGAFEWDGTNWTSIGNSFRNFYNSDTQGNPIPKTISTRGRPPLAFDPRLEAVVMMDGFEDLMWAWGGRGWMRMAPGGPVSATLNRFEGNTPPSRYLSAMVYDSEHERLVLFSGDHRRVPVTLGPNALRESDIWLYDGEVWQAPQDAQPNAVIDLAAKPDGVFHYTRVEIPEGVAVSFKPNQENTPVRWLVSGSVEIRGIVSLNGEGGTSYSGIPGSIGGEPRGGPGGFNGGHGGGNGQPAGRGGGPGGGAPATVSTGGGSAGHAKPGFGARGGAAYGRPDLRTLLGGSGGGGGFIANGVGRPGGGGGGAILIAASGRIRVFGRIEADAGIGPNGTGDGSGGAIKLVAPELLVSGELSVGVPFLGTSASLGRVRLESASLDMTGSTISVTPSTSQPLTETTDALPVQQTTTLAITNIAGQNVVTNPSGSLSTPDLEFDAAGPITITLQGSGLPVGAVATVTVVVGDIAVTTQSSAFDAAGSATATVTVPPGVGTIDAAVTIPTP